MSGDLTLFQVGGLKIIQSENWMKVSTDSRIVASLAAQIPYTKVLDIGCGIGIISLLLANHNTNADIIGIDYSSEAIRLASQSLQKNPKLVNLKFLLNSIENYNTDESFDLIVSNPPYFINQLKSISDDRNNFRHTADGFLYSFCQACLHYLTPNGRVIISTSLDNEWRWSYYMGMNGLSMSQLIYVKNKTDSKPSIVILEYRKKYFSLSINEFIIRNQSDEYSEEYLARMEGF